MSTTTCTRTDRYPSRVGGDAAIVDRADPVVRGSEGPLTADQLAAFARDGFVVLDDAIDPRLVASCLDAAHHLEGGAGGDRTASVDEPDRDGTVRSEFAIHRRHDAFARLVALPELADAARQLLGSDVYIHQSRLNLKRAFTGRGFPWHADFETWHVEDGMADMRAVSCSVALTTNDHHNGPLLLLGGSHQWFLACPGQTPADHHLQSLRRQEYGVPSPEQLRWLAERGDIAAFTGAAGSVVLFECNTMHGSADNITPDARTNAFFVYNSVDNPLGAPFGTSTPRPEHLAARTHTTPVPR